MYAAVFYGPQELRLEAVDAPALPPGGLVVDVAACTICGSDVRTLKYGKHSVRPPMVLGHELSGVVVKSDDPRFPVDTRLAAVPNVGCMRCAACLRGQEQLCQNLRVLGFQWPGGFAEQVAIPAQMVQQGAVIPLGPEIPLEHACLMEPLACAINAHEVARTGLGDEVVVFGAGPLGCLHVLVAKARGAKRVTLLDINPVRLEMAKCCNPDHLINSTVEDPHEWLMAETNQWGADVVVLATPAASAIPQGIRLAAQRGRVVLFGGLPTGQGVQPIDINDIHYRELQLIGTFGSTRRHNEMALDMIRSGRVHAGEFITHRVPLQQIHKGFALATQGSALRVAVIPGAR